MPRADWDSSDGDAPSPRVQAYAVPSTGGVVQFQPGHDLSLSAIACPARDPPGAEPMSVSAAGFDPPNRPHSVFGRASLPSLIRSLAIASLLAAGGMNTACEVATVAAIPFTLPLEIGCEIVDCAGVDSYTPGMRIPGFPTTVTLEEVSNGKILSTGDSLTIVLEPLGEVTKSDYTYSCLSLPCTIVHHRGRRSHRGVDLPGRTPPPSQATSSRESVARVVVSGNRLEITPVSDGTTLIQVTATGAMVESG